MQTFVRLSNGTDTMISGATVSGLEQFDCYFRSTICEGHLAKLRSNQPRHDTAIRTKSSRKQLRKDSHHPLRQTTYIRQIRHPRAGEAKQPFAHLTSNAPKK